MKLHLTITLPDELLGEFMQHLRDYEAPRTDFVHLDLLSEDIGMSAEDFNRMVDKLVPPIPWRRTIPTGEDIA